MESTLSQQNLVLIKSIQTVNIYIRTVSRRSIKVKLSKITLIQQIKQIIQRRLNIKKLHQVLYFKGTQIKNKSKIKLLDKSIIHVVNLLQVNLPEIKFHLKFHNFQPNDNILLNKSWTVKSEKIINEFLIDYILSQIGLELDNIGLIESCRVLNCNQTFQRENIQNDTTITVVHLVKGLKSNYFDQRLTKNANDLQIKKIVSFQQSRQKKIYTQRKNKILSVQKTNRLPKNNKKKQSTSRIVKRQRNRSIPIGVRECNCKRDKNKIEIGKSQKSQQKQKKFINQQYLRNMQKQIRLQNLHKVLLRNSSSKQSKQVLALPNMSKNQKTKLYKVKSMNLIQSHSLQDKQKNPQIQIK